MATKLNLTWQFGSCFTPFVFRVLELCPAAIGHNAIVCHTNAFVAFIIGPKGCGNYLCKRSSTARIFSPKAEKLRKKATIPPKEATALLLYISHKWWIFPMASGGNYMCCLPDRKSQQLQSRDYIGAWVYWSFSLKRKIKQHTFFIKRKKMLPDSEKGKKWQEKEWEDSVNNYSFFLGARHLPTEKSTLKSKQILPPQVSKSRFSCVKRENTILRY